MGCGRGFTASTPPPSSLRLGCRVVRRAPHLDPILQHRCGEGRGISRWHASPGCVPCCQQPRCRRRLSAVVSATQHLHPRHPTASRSYACMLAPLPMPSPDLPPAAARACPEGPTWGAARRGGRAGGQFGRAAGGTWAGATNGCSIPTNQLQRLAPIPRQRPAPSHDNAWPLPHRQRLAPTRPRSQGLPLLLQLCCGCQLAQLVRLVGLLQHLGHKALRRQRHKAHAASRRGT